MKKITPEVKHGRVSDQKGTSFKYNGWPSVCRDDRGMLYAVASSMRITHVDPCGKNCMFVSLNEGETWSCPIVVNDSYVDDRDAGIIYMGEGKMLMSWFSTAHPDYCENLLKQEWLNAVDKGICRGFSGAWKAMDQDTFRKCTGSYVKLSNDYGVTWTDPIRVPVTAPHGPTLCADGTLVYMGTMMDGKRRDKRPPISVYTSRDGGYTWEFTGAVPDGDVAKAEHMYEPHVIELPNGRLLGAIRTHCVDIDPQFTVYTTYSDDKGKTWSKPVGIGVDGSPPHLMVHSSGAVICSYSCRTEGERCERACVSYDNGETWEEDYALDNRIGQQTDMGYPATVELSDGSLITVYYQAWGDEWWTSVLYTKWKLNER